MRENRLKNYVVFGLGIALASTSAFGQAGRDISAGAVDGFFAKSFDAVPEDVRPFLRIPVEENPLRADEHLQVCWEFAMQARRILKPEYVPDDKFIIKHLLLFPATPNRKQDMAFLKCNMDGQDYMIAQTGGLQAKLVLVAQVSREANEETKSEIVAAVDKFFNVTSEDYSEKIELLRDGNLDVVKATPSRDSRRKLRRLKGVLANNEIAISVPTDDFAKQLPARVPLPNEWFEFRMRGLLPDSFPSP
jgi:hypothetical protein